MQNRKRWMTMFLGFICAGALLSACHEKDTITETSNQGQVDSSEQTLDKSTSTNTQSNELENDENTNDISNLRFIAQKISDFKRYDNYSDCYGLLDGTGEEIMPYRYRSMDRIDDNCYVIQPKDAPRALEIYVNRNGKKIKPDGKEDYSSITRLTDEYCLIYYPGQEGYAEIRRFSDYELIASMPMAFGLKEDDYVRFSEVNDHTFSVSVEGSESTFFILYDFDAILKGDANVEIASFVSSDKTYYSGLYYIGNGEYMISHYDVEDESHHQGVVDQYGNWIIRPEEGYDSIGPLLDERRVVGKYQNNNFLYGYLNQNNEQVVPLIYSYAGNFYEKTAEVCLQSKTKKDESKIFFIDKEGQQINIKENNSYSLYEELASTDYNSLPWRQLRANYSYFGPTDDPWQFIFERKTRKVYSRDEIFADIVPKSESADINNQHISASNLRDSLFGVYAINNQRTIETGGLYDLQTKTWVIAPSDQIVHIEILYDYAVAIDGLILFDFLKVTKQQNQSPIENMYENANNDNEFHIRKNIQTIDLYNKNFELIATNINDIISLSDNYILVRQGFTIGVLDAQGNWLFKKSNLSDLEHG